MIKLVPTKRITTLLLCLICITHTGLAFCPHTFNFFPAFGSPAPSAPTPGNSLLAHTCTFVGEATTVDNVVAGDMYTVDISYNITPASLTINPFVVVYDATFTPVAFGFSPVAFTAPSSGSYTTIPFADAFCTSFDGNFGCNATLWSNVTPLPPPPNDLPCNAINLTPGATCTYQTFTNDHATAAPGVPVPGCAGYLGGDVWFTTTIPASGIVSIDTQIDFVIDGGMAVYTGTCGALTLLECDDDDSPNGAMPLIQVSSQPPGTQIWIRFWEVGNNNNGDFGICVTEVSTCGTPLTNDYCESPTSIAQGPGTLVGTTSAIYTADEPGNIVSSFCGSIENNSWYQFTALSTSETFNITSVTNCVNDPSQTGIQAAVYEVFYDANGCCNILNLQSNCFSPILDPVTGTTTPNILGTVTATPLTIGNQYLLMVDGFSGDACDWAISNWVAVTLPVELSEFYGITLTEHNALRWETASEVDNDYFNVLRSYDGENFEVIGEVDGVGFSQEVNYYQFDDTDIRSGIVYYKLEQVDLNGHKEQSNIIALDRKSNRTGLIAAYPNPTTNKVTTEVNGANGRNGTISVTYMDGTLIDRKEVYTTGIEKYQFDLSNFEAGMYFVRYQDSDTDQTIKLIKQ